MLAFALEPVVTSIDTSCHREPEPGRLPIERDSMNRKPSLE